jgi:SAM-dependent methyltransferase
MSQRQDARYDSDTAQAYLQASAVFFAGNVAEAVRRLDVRDGMRVLDAGTGAGVAIRPLAEAVGRSGHVLAIDISAKAIALATRSSGAEGLPQVRLQVVDLRELVSTSAGSFDLIWAGDLFWPGNFSDPAAMIADTVGALAPGAGLAVYTSNYYQSTFLPGHPRVDLLLRAASMRRWKLPADGAPTHHDRHVRWLSDAGLEDVSLEVVPRVAFPVGPDQRIVRDYLEQAVWPDFLQAARDEGRGAGLTEDDLARIEALLAPGQPSYVVDEPGFYVMHPALVITGRRPR